METLNIVTIIVPLAFLAFCACGGELPRWMRWERTDGVASFDFPRGRGPYRSGASFGPTAGDENQSGGE